MTKRKLKSEPGDIHGVIVAGDFDISHAVAFRAATDDVKAKVLFRLRQNIAERSVVEGDDAIAVPFTGLGVLLSLLTGLVALQVAALPADAYGNVQAGLIMAVFITAIWSVVSFVWTRKVAAAREVTSVLVGRLAAYEDTLGVLAPPPPSPPAATTGGPSGATNTPGRIARLLARLRDLM